MTTEILSTDEILEAEYDGDEPRNMADLAATEEPTKKGIEFFVSMRDHTLEDMEELIVAAAAKILVGPREAVFKKAIEERAMALVRERADAILVGVSAEIIDMPLTVDFPGLASKAITMREAIGLTAREYLQKVVDRDGKPATRDRWTNAKSRIEWIVADHAAKKFGEELAAETKKVVAEVRAALKVEYEKALEAERARFAAALEALTAGKV